MWWKLYSVLLSSLTLLLFLWCYVQSCNKNDEIPVKRFSWKRVCRCQWPPNDLECLRNGQTGLYELTVKACIQKHYTNRTFTSASESQNELNDEKVSSKTWSSEKTTTQEKISVSQRKGGYFVNEEPIRLEEVVYAMRRGENVTQEPMDVLSMPVLLAPPGICHQESNIGAELDLVVLIESCIHCREQRNTARNTFMKPHLWGNFAIRFVFVTGTPADNKFDKDDENLMAMFYEAASYGDMLVANIEDQSFPHVWKQVFTFRWASAFCAQNALIFLFMDHNYSIVPKNLISFLRDCPKNALPDVNVGLYNFENIALASKAEKFDETSPEVMSSISSNSGGYAYLSGIRIVTDAAIVSAFIAPPSMEQANVRILWRMLGVSIKEVNHFVDSVKNYKKY